MNYLVRMKLIDSVRARTPEEGLALVEQRIIPTLEMCRKLAAEGKIVAGGPQSAAIALAFVLRVESVQELDEVLEGLPLWPFMETEVIPLTSFEGRLAALEPRLQRMRSQVSAARAAPR